MWELSVIWIANILFCFLFDSIVISIYWSSKAAWSDNFGPIVIALIIGNSRDESQQWKNNAQKCQLLLLNISVDNRTQVTVLYIELQEKKPLN